jgi:predicted nucleic acid-binding protein
MKIALDTNIVLDVLARREPFFEQSQAVVRLVSEGKAEGAVTANAITDIYYILRRHLDKEAVKAALRGLMELLEVAAVTGGECRAALDLAMDDYEDALLACCVRNWGAGCIVTRNAKDFANSPVRALTPGEFLDLHGGRSPFLPAMP